MRKVLACGHGKEQRLPESHEHDQIDEVNDVIAKNGISRGPAKKKKKRMTAGSNGTA